MQAIILSIGDELVLGQSVDTNSAFLSAGLTRLGILTRYHQTLADDVEAIADGIRQACAAAELVIITGGLGPTADDLTRQGLARAMGAPLVLHGPSVEVIRGFFERRGREMPEANVVQAMHPVGSTTIPNPVGTAPGIKAQVERAAVYVTPGVPREMRHMWENALEPDIRRRWPGAGSILTCKVNTFGLGESTVGQMLGPLMDRARNPRVGTTVGGGVVSVRIRSEFHDAGQAQSELDRTVAEVEHVLGPHVFGRDEATLQEAVVALLRQRRLRLATAESCTGGLVGRLVTDVAGASEVYCGGWITYCDQLKTAELGVPAEVLAQHGAVSRETVLAMAAGAQRRAGADVAVALTGIAGPEGGTPDKPVGTVWLGLAERRPGPAAPSGLAMVLPLSGDRETIRDRAAKCALQLLRFHILAVPAELLQWGRRA